jgi:hypothetical protein
MQNRIFRVSFAILFVGGLAAAAGHGDEPKKADEPNKTAQLMLKKLKFSQKVLEGVAKGDFDAIEQNADELIQVSKQTEWNVVKTADYEMFSNQFRRTADNLIKSAKDKNIDGASLAYVDMTLVCVKCHKYVREKRMTLRNEDRPAAVDGAP